MAEPKAPIVPGLEPYEQVLGENQAEYVPLTTLRGKGPNYIVMSRWTFSPEERAAIAAGADIVIGQLTFGRLFQPTFIQTVIAQPATEEQLRLTIKELGLDEELDERILKNWLDKS